MKPRPTGLRGSYSLATSPGAARSKPPKASSHTSGTRSKGSGSDGFHCRPWRCQRRAPNTSNVLASGPTRNDTGIARSPGRRAMAEPSSTTSVAGLASVSSPAARTLVLSGSPQNTSPGSSGTGLGVGTRPSAVSWNAAFTAR